jgi:hypothetical protein
MAVGTEAGMDVSAEVGIEVSTEAGIAAAEEIGRTGSIVGVFGRFKIKVMFPGKS